MDPRPTTVTTRQLTRLCERLGVVQVDSVNVLSRAHYLPFFSRLGSYDRGLLDAMRDRDPRPILETWAHEASLVPRDNWHLFNHARKRAGGGEADGEVVSKSWVDRAFERWNASIGCNLNRDVTDLVLEAVRSSGPVTARELQELVQHDQDLQAKLRQTAAPQAESWGWNWGELKTVIEFLFWSGQLCATGRNSQFERSYDVPERVLTPATLKAASEISAAEAHLELVRIAARALGIATRQSLADYFRLRLREVDPAITALIAAGELELVEVQCLGPHLLHTASRKPRKAELRTLISPFDSLIWHRDRTEQLFNMRYRIGIYTPKAKRVHGYYPLPFLYGDELVGRVDLKADRGSATLLVKQLTWESNATAAARAALTPTLAEMAEWLQLDRVVHTS